MPSEHPPNHSPGLIDAPHKRFDHARMPLIRLFTFLFLASFGASCFAQAPDAAKFFDDARQQTADIRKQLNADDVEDAKLLEFRDAASSLGAQSEALIADRTPKLAALQARLAELGPEPAKGTSEAADIAAQRTDLTKQAAALDAEIKRAKLAALDSQQLAGEVADARRTNFQARLSQRTASPLTPAFWSDIVGALARDGARLGALRDGLRAALADSFAADNRLYAFAGLMCGVLLIVLGRWWAVRALMRLTADRVPQGRLRRSAFAFAIVLATTLFAGFGVQAMVLGFDWHGAFSGAEKAFANAVVGAVFLGSFVAGLGYGLLSPARPSWRLPSIPDAIAERLRLAPALFGIAAAASLLLNRLPVVAGSSLSVTIAASFLASILHGVLFVWALARCGVVRPREQDDEPAEPRPVWLGVGLAVYWLGAFLILASSLLGFVALANLLARQMMWLLIVVSALYLLVRLVEDLFATALSSRASWAQRTLGLEPRTLDQFSVLLSGAFRVVVFLFALLIAFVPFTEPTDLIQRGSRLGGSLKLGQMEIAPSAVLGAMLVFAIGWFAVRTLQRWLGERLLPTTRMEPGMRNSVTTLLGYVGVFVVFAFSLSALGLSLERIAWVASALSVGIGFGLQAIVQNFVSGLILLAERPVKVGDLVVLGDTEGDIRRINVRATEIQLADRSTVIVPNSELITKSVRNVTLANAEGRVQFRLPLPLDTDAQRVRDILFTAIRAHPGVYEKPAPSVLIEGIQNGAIVFVATAYIASPRQSGSVRSDLLFDVLARLRTDGVALSTPYDVKLRPVPETTPMG